MPLYPATPILGAVLSLGLVAFIDGLKIALSGAFVAAAVLWYFIYARDRTNREGALAGYVRQREHDLPAGIVGAADAVAPTGSGGPTVMMALANPRTESALVTLAAALAKHDGGRVLATHVITVPDQTSLAAAAENRERIDESSEELLAAATADAAAFDVPVETRTILSHRGIKDVFDAARSNGTDTVVIGYGGQQFADGRAEVALEELTHDLPCDFLVLDGADLDVSDVLVPTAGGQSSDLPGEVARVLRETVDADVLLLHVVDPGGEAAGREFLSECATGHRLGGTRTYASRRATWRR